ncbi:MAG TPA: TIGR02266 family protein, partial [Kofleriaceae bacterium]|nr:TIGR02266 family protein [Kofleriaceae bacterium]
MDNSTRQAKRAPVTLKIKFKSETLAQFIERYAVDVSPGGIFIRTKEPLAVGTPMKFEFQLRDATPLITGEGTVVWTRENDPARPNAAPGMGVRFDRLGDGSQTILDKILAEKNKAGKEPAEGQPRLFGDAPTRVAPSPLVGQLIGESKGKLGETLPAKGGFGEDRTDTTPLPRPVPFHSDAEEFPDETFEEATKVRTMEDLIAATATGSSPPKPPPRATMVMATPPVPVPSPPSGRPPTTPPPITPSALAGTASVAPPPPPLAPL